MYNLLKNIDISLSEEQKIIFNKFTDLFIQYNQNVNLISRNDVNFLFEKHIYDSLSINLFLKNYKNNNMKMLDIGTGGGFPAIPCSILYDNLNIFAVDSINKKINFIKYISNTLKLNNIHPICSRMEDLNIKYKNSFDYAASRAMAELRIILEYSIPYIKKDGFFIAYKSIKADEELHNAQNALKILNTKLIEKIDYKLPIKENNKRVLLIFQKQSDCPVDFPRKNGIIKKNPL